MEITLSLFTQTFKDIQARLEEEGEDEVGGIPLVQIMKHPCRSQITLKFMFKNIDVYIKNLHIVLI